MSDTKYHIVEISSIEVGSFFIKNGNVHLRISDNKVVEALPHRTEVRLHKLGSEDGYNYDTMVNAADVLFHYQLKESGDVKSKSQGENRESGS
jgi:hypothetical protein